MATQQLKISRAQLAAFLKDPVSIKQFEQLFNTVADVPATGGGVTYDDIPVVSPATITATLTRIVAQLESIATAYPGADKAWAKNELNDVLTRLETLETEYPGNTKAWVKAQKYTSLGYTPINKAGDTGIGNLNMAALTAASASVAGVLGLNGGSLYGDATSGLTTILKAGSSYNLAIIDPTSSFYLLTIATGGGNGTSTWNFRGNPVSVGALTATTVKATSVGGYISSDGSTGFTGTVTTASLVGKTITIKDGIITAFA